MLNKYMIKFAKSGYMRYTSHLDMMRLFRRALKRADIQLKYTQGFNPHPKMSFAHPLSLGFTSEGEYLEFETIASHTTEEIKDTLNNVMPEGIFIKACKELQDRRKAIAASVSWADYEILDDSPFITESIIKDFQTSETIIVEKKNKKGKISHVDIKPLLGKLSLLNNDKLYALVRAGSSMNLNPELLIKALYNFVQKPYSPELIEIKRIELYDDDLIPLIDIK